MNCFGLSGPDIGPGGATLQAATPSFTPSATSAITSTAPRRPSARSQGVSASRKARSPCSGPKRTRTSSLPKGSARGGVPKVR